MYPSPLPGGASLQPSSPNSPARRALAAVLCAVFLFGGFTPVAAADEGSPPPSWIYMPPNPRAIYIGIHGGTVPVSLLTSRDGTHMVAQVGRTGNDFLRILKADPPANGRPAAQAPAAPAEPQAAAQEDGDAAAPAVVETAPPSPLPSRFAANATVFMAGTALGAMPVIYATGRSFAGIAHIYGDCLPFGLSENSTLLEGAVKGPLKATKKAKVAKPRKLQRVDIDMLN